MARASPCRAGRIPRPRSRPAVFMLFPPPPAARDVLAAQLPEGVRGDPARGRRGSPADALRFPDRRAVQSGVPFSDLPERPVYRLADEIPRIVDGPANERKQAQE